MSSSLDGVSDRGGAKGESVIGRQPITRWGARLKTKLQYELDILSYEFRSVGLSGHQNEGAAQYLVGHLTRVSPFLDYGASWSSHRAASIGA
jgi:hypothetical protein